MFTILKKIYDPSYTHDQDLITLPTITVALNLIFASIFMNIGYEILAWITAPIASLMMIRRIKISVDPKLAELNFISDINTEYKLKKAVFFIYYVPIFIVFLSNAFFYIANFNTSKIPSFLLILGIVLLVLPCLIFIRLKYQQFLRELSSRAFDELKSEDLR